MLPPEFEPLLAAAVRAPSGDNTQPWRFAIDPDGAVEFAVDEARDPSPMNAGQRMARIAIGAAVENLVRAAAARGWDARVEGGGLRVVLSRGTGDATNADAVARSLAARVTNRRVYENRPVPPELLARLAAETPPLDSVVTRWVVGGDRLAPLSAVIGKADATMFGEPTMRKAFLSKVRLDLPPDAVADDGLPLASLEASRSDRLALRMMPKMPNWLLKYSGALGVFAKKARQLVSSASGLCLVVAPDRTPETDLLVGRAMQRAWLALGDAGLAAQPMMSIPVLENVLESGAPAVVAAVGREKVEGILAEFRSLVPELAGGRPGWLMRFGYAPPPTGRTGRLPPAVTVREPVPAR